ncbi:MAG: hypothetical protein AAB853_01920 [Patescibacteria group bacterium]
MNGFTKDELRIFRALSTPRKIQDFLDTIPMNFEEEGDTSLSPRRVLRERRAHCMEGAMFAAAALRFAGYPPLVIDLKASDYDHDHVVAVFQSNKCWGAISKTNHGVLRYREPIYQSIRELVMSYFHEYTLDDGSKTLRSYTLPINLSRFDRMGWMTAEEDVWFVPNTLDSLRHLPILTRSQIAGLRKADPIERKIGKILEWRK